MKGLFILLLIGAAGYFGYAHYTGNKTVVEQQIRAALKLPESAPAAPTTAALPSTPLPVLPPPPVFESRIAAPPVAQSGEKQYAPPGVFYVVERVSMETDSGVKAVSPGERVKLLQRLNNGRMRVTTGDADFEVKASQVTNDLDLAREAEKRDFVARGGQL